jgi:hypothetical protein
MTLLLVDIVNDFAEALKGVDTLRPQGRSKSRVYREGVGPLTEAESVSKAIEYLKKRASPSPYENALPKRYPSGRQQCDLVIPGEWAIEFKLLRPFGDNGKEAEHWSENILHPYEGNSSSIGDCIKLIKSDFSERKAIIVFGYEHAPPLIELNRAVKSFEVIAKEVWGIELSERYASEFQNLIHPVHQQGKVFGWELRGNSNMELGIIGNSL